MEDELTSFLFRGESLPNVDWNGVPTPRHRDGHVDIAENVIRYLDRKRYCHYTPELKYFWKYIIHIWAKFGKNVFLRMEYAEREIPRKYPIGVILEYVLCPKMRENLFIDICKYAQLNYDEEYKIMMDIIETHSPKVIELFLRRLGWEVFIPYIIDNGEFWILEHIDATPAEIMDNIYGRTLSAWCEDFVTRELFERINEVKKVIEQRQRLNC